MNPADIRIGFVPIARPTFDLDLARQVTAQLYAAVQSAGYQLVGSQELVMDGPAIEERIDELKAANIDMILVAQSSFADSAMVLQLARAIPAPLLMWAFSRGTGRWPAAHQFLLWHQPGGAMACVALAWVTIRCMRSPKIQTRSRN